MNPRLLFCALVAFSVGALNLQAQTDTWNVSSGIWSTGANWSNGVPSSGSDVQFSNSSIYTSTVDSSYTITSFSIAGAGQFNLSTTGPNTLTTSGTNSFGGSNVDEINVSLAGTGNLWLNGGTGTLILNPAPGTNTYSGSTQVYAGGTLADGGVDSFSANSVLYVGSALGGTVIVNYNESIASLADVAGGPGSVAIASGATLDLVGGYTGSFSGVISGAGNFEKDNTGTLMLTGANTYTGTTVINGAGGTVIELGNGGTTGSIVSSSVSGTGTLAFDLSSNYTYGGTLSGALQVGQVGAGTTKLTGTNTYTGATTVNAGVLQAGSTSAFGNLSAVTINGSGTLDLNNFSNTVGALNSASTTSSVTLGIGTLTIGTAAVNSTFEGTISGGGGLTLNNVDGYTLTLSGSNTYTGPTNVTNGTLLAINTTGTAVGTGPISIGSGGVLQVGSISTTGFIGIANIADNGTLTFARTDSNTISNTISGTGGVTVDRGAITLTGNNSYSGITSIFNSAVNVGSATALGNTSVVELSTNGSLNLGAFNTYVGNISSPGDTSTLINLGTSTLTLSNPASNQTFAGTIMGSGSLVVFSTLDVTSTTNSYFGGTTISGGTLIADNVSGSATGSGAVTISGGGTLVIGNDSATGYITTAAITDNGLVDFQRNDSISFPSTINGTGGVEAQDGGTITLTGINTYSGLTNVTGGPTGTTLTAGSTSAFGNGTSALSLSPGGSSATVNLNGFNIAVGSVVGNTNTFITLGSGTLTTGAAGGTNIYGGIISGSGGLDVAAPGNVVLTGANTYFGPTSIAAGGSLELGFGGITGSIANSSGISGGGTLQFDETGAIAYAGPISGTLSVVQSGSGTTILSGSNSYSGMTSVNNGTLADGTANSFSPNSPMLVNSSGGHLDVNFNETVGNLENGGSGGPVVIASGATLTSEGLSYVGDFNGLISGAGSFIINGGTQGLSGANTFGGGVTLESGELYIGGNSAVGTGTLTLDAGTNIAPEANATLSNPVVLSGSGYVINNWGPSNLTLTGTVSGTAELSWCTTNTLTLTGNNTFTGGIDMREGTLLLGSDTAAGVGGTIILDSSTLLAALGGPGITRTVANPINFTGGSAALGNNDDNYLDLTGAISGGGAVAFLGGSTGTLTLSPSSNTYNGNFEIASGTVFAANNNALSSAASVLLAGSTTLNVENGVTVSSPLIFSGAPNTLAGNGTISSTVTAGSSTIISPSASPGGGPGSLTFSNGLVLGSGVAIHFELYDANGTAGTGYGLINASGGLDLTASNNTITFNIVSTNSTGGAANALNFNPATPYSWTFASSTTPITGFSASQFNLITSGFLNSTAGGGFSVTESGNSLDLMLNFTPVPEPTTWALMGAGILTLATLEIRRRRQARA